MDISHLTITFGELLTILVVVVGLLTHYFSTNNRITKLETVQSEFQKHTVERSKMWEDTFKRDIDQLFKMIRECPGLTHTHNKED